MPKLDTAYLSTILDEEQRTLLRFATYLEIPVAIDGPWNSTRKGELISYLSTAGIEAVDAMEIRESTIQHASAYIVLTLSH